MIKHKNNGNGVEAGGTEKAKSATCLSCNKMPAVMLQPQETVVQRLRVLLLNNSMQTQLRNRIVRAVSSQQSLAYAVIGPGRVISCTQKQTNKLGQRCQSEWHRGSKGLCSH